MKKILSLLVLAFIIITASAQYDIELGYKTTDIGAEIQWYPAGTITGIHIAMNAKIHHSVHLRFGYNKANRKDWGENDNETGGGWGGTIGYRYYFKPFPHKFFIGARSDLWRMKMNWTEGLQSGTTKTWTLQPTFEIGYTFFINDQAFLTPSFANGAEINIQTDGQKVGQGFVTLIGLSAGIRL